MGQVPPGDLIIPITLSIFFALCLLAILAFLMKGIQKAELSSSLLILFFFFYGPAYDARAVLGLGPFLLSLPYDSSIVFLIIWSVLAFISIYCVLKYCRSLLTVTRAFNIIAIVLIVMPLANIFRYTITKNMAWWSSANSEDKLSLPINSKADLIRPDIYYIILDSYAGIDVLKEFYDFDNSVFYNFLLEKGFHIIRNSKSNYSWTMLSLASSLNLDYIVPLFDNHYDANSNDTAPLIKMIKNNRTMHILKEFGYKSVAFSAWYAGLDMSTADIYFRPNFFLNEFHFALLNTTPIPVAAKNLASFDIISAAYKGNILYKLNSLGSAIKKGADAPLFVFLYLEAPHPPFVFRPDGKEINLVGWHNDREGNWRIDKGNLTKAEFIHLYTDQLQFINNSLRAVIDRILNESNIKPIILLQSDHGPHSKFFWDRSDALNQREGVAILNALYSPSSDGDYLYGGMTPVNTFRMIFNKYFGGNYRLLADKSYFSTAQYPYKFIEIGH